MKTESIAYLTTHQDPETGLFLCCKDESNLEEKERTPLVGTRADGEKLAATRVVRVCKLCGRRHFELIVEPIELNMDGAPI